MSVTWLSAAMPSSKTQIRWDTDCGPESRHKGHKRTRNCCETGEIKTGNGESGEQQLLDKISSGSQISGYFGMIAGPDLIWVSAKSNLGPLCKYLCLWSIAVLRNYVSHSKKCQLMPSSQQEIPQQHLCYKRNSLKVVKGNQMIKAIIFSCIMKVKS